MMLLLQNVALVLGVVSLIVAGWQDKHTRIAPAIFAAPFFIALSINLFLGLIVGFLSIILVFLWDNKYNSLIKMGLGDVFFYIFTILLFFTPLLLINFASLIIVLPLLYFKKEQETPLIYYHSIAILISTVIFSFIKIGGFIG